MSIEDFVQAAQLFLASASQREFISIIGSAALALVSLSTAVLTYMSNRVLTAQVIDTRDQLMTKEIEVVRVKAATEESQKALDRIRRELDEREANIRKQEQNRRVLLQILKQSDEDVWIRHEPLLKPRDHDTRIARRRPIVMLVANNKGGVGKSAVTLNMAAFFDKNQLVQGKKRLLLDLDYQGTSSYVLTKAVDILERQSRAQMLMSEGASELDLFSARIGLNPVLPTTELVPSFYELARHEDRLLMEWLLGESGDDLRYRLSRVLHADIVADQYDLVLIDAPPRLTTGTINGLCASTHLLVPTSFTGVSAEPVANFLAMARAVKDKLNPNLKMIGVVETLTPTGSVSQAAKDARALARLTVERALQTYFPDASIFARDVPRMNAMIDDGLASQDDPKVEAIFEQLCTEIRGKLT